MNIQCRSALTSTFNIQNWTFIISAEKKSRFV